MVGGTTEKSSSARRHTTKREATQIIQPQHCSREKRERGRERKKTLIKIRITYSPFSMSPNITATRTDIFLLQCHLNIIWHIPSQLRNSCSADDEVLLLGDPFIKASTESVNFSRSPSNKQTNRLTGQLLSTHEFYESPI